VFRCVVCRESFDWQRSCAEESIPRECPKCERNIEYIKYLLGDAINVLSQARNLDKAKEIVDEMLKTYNEKSRNMELVPRSEYW